MSAEAEFYVGYFNMPRRLAGFMRAVVPGLAAIAVALGAFTARSQNDPGSGLWHEDVAELIGQIEESPYPLVRVPLNDGAQSIETILLVSEGKRGAREQTVGLSGKTVRVRGTILERDGRRLLELADENSIRPVTGSVHMVLAVPKITDLGHVTLRGEIVDPKCYCGAMKPGEGKTHKECATLCIAGGIPPVFVTIDPTGNHRYYLLTNPAGMPLDERILPFVADAVEVSGDLEQRDDLTLFKVDPTAIHRL